MVVVLPTYNEMENLPALVPRLLDIAPVCVLIVDDDSPDGTGQVADELREEFPSRVGVLHRRGVPRGLGLAYSDGFASALEQGADIVIGMDADQSHSPEYIPTMLNIMVQEDHDIVVGSRYIPGGGVDGGWGWQRRLLSRAAQLWARRLLGLATHDVTGAFRCYSRRALQTLDLEQMHLDGFSFLIEIIHQAERNQLRIAEIPIRFRDREYGMSKVTPRIVVAAVVQVLGLRLRGGS